MSIKTVRKRLSELQGRVKYLEGRREQVTAQMDASTARYNKALKARVIIQEAAQATQGNLEAYFTSIVTLALHAVPFEQQNDFQLEFVKSHNKSMAHVWFLKNGERLNPLDCSGGGALNIASLASQFTFWSINPTRPCMLLDEPLRDLSADYHAAASDMLKMLSERLGLQIIMVSHNEGIKEACDNLIYV